MLGTFHIGGLNSYLVAGSTVTGAFVLHVAEIGAMVVFYAPDISITRAGTIVEIHRFGQNKNSACCGVAKGALEKLPGNQIQWDNDTDLYYRMNTIEQIFLRDERWIKALPNQIFEAAEVMYEAIKDRIKVLMN
ncbi:hypothetical protein [Pedobacter panaciterrae]